MPNIITIESNNGESPKDIKVVVETTEVVQKFKGSISDIDSEIESLNINIEMANSDIIKAKEKITELQTLKSEIQAKLDSELTTKE